MLLIYFRASAHYIGKLSQYENQMIMSSQHFGWSAWVRVAFENQEQNKPVKIVKET